jgi:hypothetical protein
LNNHYNTLVSNGFLSKAGEQIEKAASTIHGPIGIVENFDDIKAEWMWHFDRNEKKLDFDYLREELCLYKHVADHLNELDKDHDVMVLNALDIIIYVSPNKKSIQKSLDLDLIEHGSIPYYITKRKVEGVFLWFALTWTVFPFQPFNEN